MNLRKYWMLYGKDGLQRLADATGTTLSYLRQLSWGYRNPSPDLAQRLVEAANGELTLDAVLYDNRRERPEVFRSRKKKAA